MLRSPRNGRGKIAFLSGILKDPGLRDLAEADFQEYYYVDLRDLWRKGSGLTYRRAASFLWLLPTKSRVKQHLPEDHELWDRTDHHRQDIVDVLQQILYFTATSAMMRDGLKQSDVSKIQKKAPKPIVRPGQKKEEKKIVFLSAKQFKRMLQDNPDWKGIERR